MHNFITSKLINCSLTKACGALDSLNDHLGEISNKMAASVIGFSHHIKEEWLHVVVQCLVVQEEFGKETKVLAINLQTANDIC